MQHFCFQKQGMWATHTVARGEGERGSFKDREPSLRRPCLPFFSHQIPHLIKTSRVLAGGCQSSTKPGFILSHISAFSLTYDPLALGSKSTQAESKQHGDGVMGTSGSQTLG